MRGQGKNGLGMLGWAAVALACMFGLGMTGGVDGKSPPPDLSKLGQLFDVEDTPAERDEKPDKSTTKGPSAKAKKMCPDDPEHCWWQ